MIENTDRPEKEERLLAEIMKDFRMENPPSGFTANVMGRLEGVNVSEGTYRPLISRAGWIGIAAGFLIILALIFTSSETQVPGESGWLSQQFDQVAQPVGNLLSADLFSWIKLDNPVLFWIITGIAGFVLLAVLQRLITSRPLHHLNSL